MSIVSKPNTFSPSTTISSSAVNANFDTIINDYNGGITSANLATDSVTTAKIADSNVTTAKINDSAVTTVKLNDASVTGAKLTTGAGEPGGAWNAWTPTFANFTLGSGTMVARYKQISKTVHFQIIITLNSSTMGTGPTFSLPATADANAQVAGVSAIGVGVLNDSGVAEYQGALVYTSTTTVSMRCVGASGTYTNLPPLTSTAPFTWGNSDKISFYGTYEAA